MVDVTGSERPVVLIVDDSRMIRVSLRKVLESEFELLDAADGHEALDALCTDERIQVVVTDAGMPNMDGYELIACVREHQNERIRQVPIIMVTAAEDSEARDRALEAGATDFILKPFDKSELLARVRAQVKLDRTARALAETAGALQEYSAEDTVTGLASKRYFMNRGEQDLAFAKRHENDLTVIGLSIDGFADIQQLQDDAGINELLRVLAEIFKSSVRKEDTVARLGVDQFGILAPTAGPQDADAICNRIRAQVVARNFSIGKPLTLSIGQVFLHELELTTIEAYLQLAQERMLEARQAGGDRVVTEVKSESVPKASPMVSLDAALKVLDKGESERLRPYVTSILQRVLPLLEYCNATENLDLAEQIEAIRRRSQSS